MMQIINNTGAIIKEQINLGDINNLNIDDLLKNNTNNKKMENNKRPTWHIPLNIIKELKAIGFDKGSVISYSVGTGITAIRKELYPWEQVFEWFREEGLYGFILFDNTYPNSERETFSFEIRKINRELIYSSENNSTDEFNSYEEARESLVKALIQTYKNEQL